MPDSALLRAQARYWIQRLNQEFGNALFFIGISDNTDTIQKHLASLKTILNDVERHLQGRTNGFWLGEQPGLVDISYYTATERLPVVESKTDLSLYNYPGIQTWFGAMSEIPIVKQTAKTGAEHIRLFAELSKKIPG